MDEGILFETNGGRLRQGRKLVASGTGPRELEKFRPQLQSHIVSFLGRLLQHPDRFLKHVRE